MISFGQIERKVLNCFSKIWGKQFLTFLFFLFLSMVFWMISTLNETYKQDFAVPLRLINVPKNVVITTNLPKEIHVMITDKGFTLFALRFGRLKSPITVDFSTYARDNGKAYLNINDLTKQISSQIPSSAIITHLRPQNLYFYFNYGESKKVPVRLDGELVSDERFYISGTHINPDSVTVYAQREILDTITEALTRRVYQKDLSGNVHFGTPLQEAAGVKFIPSQVKVSVDVDRLVEKTVQVPVQQVNFPATKVLRTFPAKVNITFQVGMKLYKRITADNFVLTVNYEDLKANKNKTCHLTLKTIPTGVRYVRINPQDVDYVIEDVIDPYIDNE